MPRLNIERQNELEPKRLAYAIDSIQKLGFTITEITDKYIKFDYHGKTVTVYPYSGYFSGKSVKSGRGIDYLLQQLKNPIK